jgi:hypothetical protein
MNQEQINEILEMHKLWLEGKPEGKQAYFEWLDLRGADLKGVNLQGVNFRVADLRKANFQKANLQEGDFYMANLCSANLKEADLIGANLQSARLNGADLEGANLNGADFEGADLDYSCWPLSCKTKDVKLCKKLQAQLIAHAFQVAPDFPMSDEIHKLIKENFHRYDEFFTRGNNDTKYRS